MRESRLFVSIIALLLVASAVRPGFTQDDDKEELSKDVTRVFRTICAQCHDPSGENPKAIKKWKKKHTGKPVSPHYRFNWVYCEVRIDNEEHDDGQASDAGTQAAVKENLEESRGFPALAQAIKADPEVQSWLDRNGLDWD